MKNNASPEELRIFLAVVQERGFRAAAKRLGLAPSKVSTTVSRLEAELGVPLLLRSTRSVEATDQGRRLAEKIAPLFSGIDAAVSEATSSTDQVRGRLKLNVPGAVMPDILPPILARFQSLHPHVNVEIIVENELVDIIAAGCDAGIRYGAHLAQDMVSVPIGPRQQQLALAASPDYLAQHGQPRLPAELMGHQTIRYRLPGGTLLPWLVQQDGEMVNIDPGASLILSVNALNTGLGFARAGLGIIGVFRNWCEADFASGNLVPLLPQFWAGLDGPRLYYPSRFAAAPLRAFIEVCRSNLMDEPSWQSD